MERLYKVDRPQWETWSGSASSGMVALSGPGLRHWALTGNESIPLALKHGDRGQTSSVGNEWISFSHVNKESLMKPSHPYAGEVKCGLSDCGTTCAGRFIHSLSPLSVDRLGTLTGERDFSLRERRHFRVLAWMIVGLVYSRHSTS